MEINILHCSIVTNINSIVYFIAVLNIKINSFCSIKSFFLFYFFPNIFCQVVFIGSLFICFNPIYIFFLVLILESTYIIICFLVLNLFFILIINFFLIFYFTCIFTFQNVYLLLFLYCLQN